MRGYAVSMIANINKDFLDKWEGFPGPNFLKFFFVILGLFCWLEVIIPGLNSISLFLIPLFKTGNIIIMFFSFIILMGCLDHDQTVLNYDHMDIGKQSDAFEGLSDC